jgi:RHS repeat-associated protein
MLRFHDPNMAPPRWINYYWGEDLIPVGPYDPSPFHMGPVPYQPNRWLMLMVDRTYTSWRNIDGICYNLFGGEAYWDYTAVAPYHSGHVIIENLNPGDTVSFHENEDESAKFSSGVPPGDTKAYLNFYGDGDYNAFPVRGFFTITTSNGEYRSPIFPNIWGGDVYRFSPDRFPTTAIPLDSNIHHRLISQQEWQSGKEVLNFSFDMEVEDSDQIIDGSGYRNIGENQGSTETAGIIGNARYFEYGDGIKVTDNTVLDTSDEFTISMWIKPEAYTDPSGYPSFFISKWKSTGSNPPGQYILGFSGADKKLKLWLGKEGDTIGIYDTKISDGEIRLNVWTHVVATFDKGLVKLYINGDIDISEISNVDRLSALEYSTDDLFVGRYHDNDYYKYQGYLDEVKVFNKALDSHQINDLFVRNSAHLMISKFKHETHGLLEEAKILNEGDWLMSTFNYDDYGNLISFTDAKTHALEFYYQPGPPYYGAYLTMTTSYVDGDDIEVYYTYYENTGQLKSETDPRNPAFITEYQYDIVGRVTLIKYPETEGVRGEVEYQYDDENRKVTTFDENNLKTVSKSDELGRVVRTEWYDRNNDLYAFDETTYNWQEKVQSYTDALGNTYSYSYDFLGRMKELVNPPMEYYNEPIPIATAKSIDFDDVNSIVTITDENNHKMAYVSDLKGQLIETREYYDASNYYSTFYDYDESGNLISVTNAKSETTTHYYDDQNRLIKTEFPDGTFESYSYDDVGNLEEKLDRGGITAYYYYDDLDRLDYVQRGDDNTISYMYDNADNVKCVGFPGGATECDPSYSYEYSYDARNRLTQEISNTEIGEQFIVDYDYDLAGNIEKITYPDGSFIRYIPDEIYRTGEVKLNDVTTIATYAYNLDGSIDTITYGNGHYENYLYYERGWVESIELRDSTDALIDSYQYVYDKVGNIRTIEEYIDPEVFLKYFEYDNLNRLTRADGPWEFGLNTIEYVYDEVGNRLRKNVGTFPTYYNEIYTYGTYNELLSVEYEPYGYYDPKYFSYDDYGNMVQKVVDADTWEYLYDYGSLAKENELSQVKKNGDLEIEFKYDAFGRAFNTIEYHTGGSTTTTTYIYAALGVIYELNDYIHTPDIIKFVYANGRLIARMADGDIFYYHQDHLGNTRRVTRFDGYSIFTSDYYPFGMPLNEMNSLFYPTKHKFTGERWEDKLDLYYLFRRYYDPELGRFISQDPVLGALKQPQTLNRYAYVINNPLRFTDPTGEFLNILIGAIAGALIGGIGCWLAGGEDCWKAALMGAAVGAFAGATFGLGMSAFGVGTAAEVAASSASIVAGSWASVGAGVLTGMAVGAQTYFLASSLGIASGQMTPQDLNMEEFGLSVGLGGLFGGFGGKAYNPAEPWGYNPFAKLREVELHPHGLKPISKPMTPKEAASMGKGHSFYGSRGAAYRAARLAGAEKQVVIDAPHLGGIKIIKGDVRFWHYHPYMRTPKYMHFFFGKGVIKT